jgi:glycosyltransferase involved in cell wall biosynthesis
MTELVSVVILAHRHAALLSAAIDSVLAQGDPAVELLVVEHEPSEAVAEIVERHGDEPVQLLPSGGKTPGAARNAGTSAASGSLIAFLDGDDLWPPGRLVAARAALEADPGLDVVFGRMCAFENRGATPIADPAEAARIAGPPESGRLITAALLRRTGFERVGRFEQETVLGSEIDWIARAEDARLRFGWLEEVVLLRRSHAENTTRIQRDDYGEYARVLKRVIDRRRDHP